MKACKNGNCTEIVCNRGECSSINDDPAQEDMYFELGKAYKHISGTKMKIIGLADSTMHGRGLVGETSKGDCLMCGTANMPIKGWTVISEEDWIKYFVDGEVK